MRSKRGRSSSAKSLGNGAVGVSLLISWTRPNNPSSELSASKKTKPRYSEVYARIVSCFRKPLLQLLYIQEFEYETWSIGVAIIIIRFVAFVVEIWRFSEDRQTLPRAQGALLINGERFTVLFRLPDQMDRTELSIENLDCLER